MLTFLLITGAILLVAAVFGWLWIRSTREKMAAAREADQERRQERLENLPAIPLSDREDEGIYQWSFHHGDRLVARAVRPEVDESGRQVRFLEITHSDLLLLPDECHFGKYKLEIDTVGDAVKVDKTEPDKGRILREVTAQITGYVEQ